MKTPGEPPAASKPSENPAGDAPKLVRETPAFRRELERTVQAVQRRWRSLAALKPVNPSPRPPVESTVPEQKPLKVSPSPSPSTR